MDELPRNSTELRARMNEIASDASWKPLWTSRGHNIADVIECLKKMRDEAIKREKAGDPVGFTAWCKHILNYQQGKLMEETVGDAYEGPIGPGMVFLAPPDEAPTLAIYEGSPEEEDGPRHWLELCDRNPHRTFKEAIYLYQRQHGYWPNPRWPGMPLNREDKGRKIGKVSRERLIPLKPENADGQDTDETRTRQAGTTSWDGTQDDQGD